MNTRTRGRAGVTGALLALLVAVVSFATYARRESPSLADAALSPGENREELVSERHAPVLPGTEAASRRTDALELAAQHEGGIYGRVLDDENEGLAGVVVRLAPMGGINSVILFGTDSAELEHTAETLTDDEGRYSFDELEGEGWGVFAEHSDYEVEPESKSRVHELGSETNFRATRFVVVEVSVYEPDGELASEAILRSVKSFRVGNLNDFVPSKPKVHPWTPNEPQLRLVPGAYRMSAYSSEGLADDDAEFRSAGQDVDLRQEGEQVALRFDLRPRPGIAGRVVAFPGDALPAGLVVHMMPLEPGQDVDFGLLAAGAVRAGAGATPRLAGR